MSAKILHTVNLNRKIVWALNGRHFIHTGVRFEIIGSSSTGPGVYDVMHTVKNIDKGAYADVMMSKLVEILKTADA